jgi:aryl-alcohol dehydrogenase-like predicted oxidoreductase
MRFTRLGRTELDVSRICFGTWAFSGAWGEFAEDEAIRAIRTALDLGINFFDTAQAYGFGVAERILGRALRPELRTNREAIVLATKGGLRLEGGRLLRDSSAAWLRTGLEQSLKNLGVEYVDIYQVHWPDPAAPIEETARVVDTFVREGKVRYAGVSNYDVGQMERFRSVRPLDTQQPMYNAFHRQVERDVLPYCLEHGIGVLAYSPLAHGLLTGKFTAETRFPPGDWRSASPVFRGESFERNLRVVARLAELAHAEERPLAQLAIAWVLSHPAVHSAIVGARSGGQIAATAAAAEWTFTEELRGAIEGVLAEAAEVRSPAPESA